MICISHGSFVGLLCDINMLFVLQNGVRYYLKYLIKLFPRHLTFYCRMRNFFQKKVGIELFFIFYNIGY